MKEAETKFEQAVNLSKEANNNIFYWKGQVDLITKLMQENKDE